MWAAFQARPHPQSGSSTPPTPLSCFSFCFLLHMLYRFAEYFDTFLLWKNRDYSVCTYGSGVFFLQYFKENLNHRIFTHKSMYLISMVFLFCFKPEHSKNRAGQGLHQIDMCCVVLTASSHLVWGLPAFCPLRSTLSFFKKSILCIKTVPYYMYSSVSIPVTFFIQDSQIHPC